MGASERLLEVLAGPAADESLGAPTRAFDRKCTELLDELGGHVGYVLGLGEGLAAVGRIVDLAAVAGEHDDVRHLLAEVAAVQEQLRAQRDSWASDCRLLWTAFGDLVEIAQVDPEWLLEQKAPSLLTRIVANELGGEEPDAERREAARETLADLVLAEAERLTTSEEGTS